MLWFAGMADDLRLVSDDDLVHVPDGAALTDEGASLSLRALVGSAAAVTSARPLSFAGGFDAGTHGSFSAWVWLWQAPQRGKRATVFSSSPTPPDGSALVVSVGVGAGPRPQHWHLAAGASGSRLAVRGSPKLAQPWKWTHLAVISSPLAAGLPSTSDHLHPASAGSTADQPTAAAEPRTDSQSQVQMPSSTGPTPRLAARGAQRLVLLVDGSRAASLTIALPRCAAERTVEAALAAARHAAGRDAARSPSHVLGTAVRAPSVWKEEEEEENTSRPARGHQAPANTSPRPPERGKPLSRWPRWGTSHPFDAASLWERAAAKSTPAREALDSAPAPLGPDPLLQGVYDPPPGRHGAGWWRRQRSRGSRGVLSPVLISLAEPSAQALAIGGQRPSRSAPVLVTRATATNGEGGGGWRQLEARVQAEAEQEPPTQPPQWLVAAVSVPLSAAASTEGDAPRQEGRTEDVGKAVGAALAVRASMCGGGGTTLARPSQLADALLQGTQALAQAGGVRALPLPGFAMQGSCVPPRVLLAALNAEERPGGQYRAQAADAVARRLAAGVHRERHAIARWMRLLSVLAAEAGLAIPALPPLTAEAGTAPPDADAALVAPRASTQAADGLSASQPGATQEGSAGTSDAHHSWLDKVGRTAAALHRGARDERCGFQWASVQSSAAALVGDRSPAMETEPCGGEHGAALGWEVPPQLRGAVRAVPPKLRAAIAALRRIGAGRLASLPAAAQALGGWDSATGLAAPPLEELWGTWPASSFSEPVPELLPPSRRGSHSGHSSEARAAARRSLQAADGSVWLDATAQAAAAGRDLDRDAEAVVRGPGCAASLAAALAALKQEAARPRSAWDRDERELASEGQSAVEEAAPSHWAADDGSTEAAGWWTGLRQWLASLADVDAEGRLHRAEEGVLWLRAKQGSGWAARELVLRLWQSYYNHLMPTKNHCVIG